MKYRSLYIVMVVSVALSATVRVVFLSSPWHPDDFFWSEAFQREKKLSDQIWQMADNGMYYTPDDLNGEWINTKDGFRRTVGQPANPVGTIWILGSSTTFSAQVPDEDTFPSQLQVLLPQYRVMNVGMAGVLAFHETQRLKTLPVQKGDIVIFYDGQRDMWNLIQDNSAAAVASMVRDYRKAIAEAQRYATEKGAAFYHFLEPQIFAVRPKPWEDSMVPEQAYAVGWPAVQRTETGADFTHLLDNARREGSCYYYETNHVNAVCNAIIARAIFDAITIF